MLDDFCSDDGAAGGSSPPLPRSGPIEAGGPLTSSSSLVTAVPASPVPHALSTAPVANNSVADGNAEAQNDEVRLLLDWLTRSS